MMPGGFRGMNPKKMSAMMKQLGIDVTEIENVERVVITTAAKEIVLERPNVSIMRASGTETFQVVGASSERARDGVQASAPTPAPQASSADDDARLVAEQARVSMDDARAALAACDGRPADAILKLIGEG